MFLHPHPCHLSAPVPSLVTLRVFGEVTRYSMVCCGFAAILFHTACLHQVHSYFICNHC